MSERIQVLQRALRRQIVAIGVTSVVLVVGLGGVFAEALHDVRVLPPDLDTTEIEAELLKLKGAALLKEFRGAPARDVAAGSQPLSAAICAASTSTGTAAQRFAACLMIERYCSGTTIEPPKWP